MPDDTPLRSLAASRRGYGGAGARGAGDGVAVEGRTGAEGADHQLGAGVLKAHVPAGVPDRVAAAGWMRGAGLVLAPVIWWGSAGGTRYGYSIQTYSRFC